MNPQEDSNPYQTPSQPGSTPGGMPQYGAEPQGPAQSGVFVGGPGVSGAQMPSSQPPQPTAPQPQPYHQPQQHPAYPSDPSPQPTAQPPQPYAHPQQPFPGSPAPNPTMPPAHDSHGHWQPPTHSGSSYPTHGGQNTKLIVIIAAAVFVLLLAVGIFFVMKGNNPVSNLTNSITGNSDVVDRSDGTLDLSELIDPVDTIKNQDITAKLNQQVNLSDGSSYMVTSVERNWTNPEVKAASGKELIKVNVVVGNKSKEGGLYFSDNFFRLKNSAGGLQDSEYVTEEEVPDMLVGGEVAPGKQKKGAIIYEVDKDEQLGGLITEDKYTKFGSDDEITVKSIVTF